jgi:cytoskeletal protein RodZ
VGADHKGPLAAFVVVAIIAAVLLVTSVRSQAEPGWQHLRRLVAGPAAQAVMPHGVQQPAAPPPTSPSAPSGTTDPSSSLGAAQGTPTTPTTPSSPGTRTTQGPAGNASHVAGTPRHTGQATITSNPSLGDQPVADPSGAPDSPGSADPTLAAQHGFGPEGMLGPRHGDSTWKPQPWWPVAWHHWLSWGGAGHQWGRGPGRRQHHRPH